MFRERIFVNFIAHELIFSDGEARMESIGFQWAIAGAINFFVNFSKTVHLLWFPDWLERFTFLFENLQLHWLRLFGLPQDNAAQFTVKTNVLIIRVEIPLTFPFLSFLGLFLLASKHFDKSGDCTFEFGFETLRPIFLVIDSVRELLSEHMPRWSVQVKWLILRRSHFSANFILNSIHN